MLDANSLEWFNIVILFLFDILNSIIRNGEGASRLHTIS